MRTNDVKLIAFHLPQFHSFPENDEWWGRGFTEWTNTRKANRLYPEHNQPREPLNDHYYDLTDLNEMLWQMSMARQYGVYGFCYYHYWFNGKRLLHKPLEAVRDYSGEKLPYCLCWANEPWTRTWEGNARKVLMPQEYGNEPEWEEHFQYLLTFFRDSSYIKKDGRPLLVLYRTNSIPRCEDMIAYWDKRCVQNGYSGIYVVEEITCYQSAPVCASSAAFIEFEPLYSMTIGRSTADKIFYKAQSIMFNSAYHTQCQIYDYDRLWNRIIHRRHMLIDGKVCYLGGFVDWDNTARKGKKGRIVKGTTPEKFGKYMKEQKAIAESIGSEYIFINAWNEWGEGTYLEPDKRNEYAYLRHINEIFGGDEPRL